MDSEAHPASESEQRVTEGTAYGDPDFGDTVYNDGPENNPQLDTPDSLLDDDLLADPLDTGYSPPDFDPGTDRFGTTAQEQLEGESLDDRLAQEVPDVSAADDPIGDPGSVDNVADPRSGRLVAPDEGSHEDTESDAVAFDAGIDGGAASAEEAAMHVVGEDDALLN